jgi:hypothetical protein
MNTYFSDKKGPIEELSWGRFIINGEEHGKTSEGKTGVGKDIRLIGEKVSKWKEREGHVLSADMIAGVFDNNLHRLIIGKGIEGRMSIPREVVDFIKSKGIEEVIIENTPEACKTYNTSFHKGEKVALLAHGTC